MNPIHRYFRDIWLGVTTTLVGMNVTWRHFFMPTITVQYPHQKLTYPPRARAALVNTVSICNGCQQCARACPVNIIAIKTVKALPEEDLGETPDGKKRRLHIVQFDVDMSKCVFCGFCVDACPTEAIHWESPHQQVEFQRKLLVRDWARMNPEDKKRLLERDAAAKAAKAAAPAHAEGAKPKENE
jgi:NADH-quinone oxidoreductase subunit I